MTEYHKESMKSNPKEGMKLMHGLGTWLFPHYLHLSTPSCVTSGDCSYLMKERVKG